MGCSGNCSNRRFIRNYKSFTAIIIIITTTTIVIITTATITTTTITAATEAMPDTVCAIIPAAPKAKDWNPREILKGNWSWGGSFKQEAKGSAERHTCWK